MQGEVIDINDDNVGLINDLVEALTILIYGYQTLKINESKIKEDDSFLTLYSYLEGSAYGGKFCVTLLKDSVKKIRQKSMELKINLETIYNVANLAPRMNGIDKKHDMIKYYNTLFEMESRIKNR